MDDIILETDDAVVDAPVFVKLPLDQLPARGTEARAEYRRLRRAAARAARKARRAATPDAPDAAPDALAA